ncbi:hypothetical protein BY458DRAFT_526218 [Sporodiniella umbellata]|nr:hypothetical protein BY458DRAFT_526218 [Sporodiniella umbellata]
MMLLLEFNAHFIFVMLLALMLVNFNMCFGLEPPISSSSIYLQERSENENDSDGDWRDKWRKEDRDRKNDDRERYHHFPPWADPEVGFNRSRYPGPFGTPSNTIVTTVIVTTVESPTSLPTIYTGENQPANQQGYSDGSNTGVDPNSSVDNTASSNNKYGNGRRAFRTLELALSIVGSITGTILIVGIFMFARRKIHKNKNVQLEKQLADASLPSGPTHPHHSLEPSSSIECRHQGFKDDSTIVDFSMNSFYDTNKNRASHTNRSTSNRLSLEPCLSSNCRTNHITIMPMLTNAAQPSAPPAEEIKDSLYQERLMGESRQYETASSSKNSCTLTFNDEIDLGLHFSNQELPPPAYAANLAPTAPPLYALPEGSSSKDPRRQSSSSETKQ